MYEAIGRGLTLWGAKHPAAKCDHVDGLVAWQYRHQLCRIAIGFRHRDTRRLLASNRYRNDLRPTLRRCRDLRTRPSMAGSTRGICRVNASGLSLLGPVVYHNAAR